MNEGKQSILVPPQWVQLLEVSGWLERIFEVPASGLYRKLCLAVRDARTINHRIGKPSVRNIRDALPPGLYPHEYAEGRCDEYGYYTCSYYAKDWERCQADFNSGTAMQGEKRVAIEVLWFDVERWAEPLVAELQRTLKTPHGAPSSTDAAAKTLAATKDEQETIAIVFEKPFIPPALNKKRGRPAVVTNRIIEKMILDYRGDPRGLKKEKIVTLKERYGSSEGTIHNAQRTACDRLNTLSSETDSENSREKANTKK